VTRVNVQVDHVKILRAVRLKQPMLAGKMTTILEEPLQSELSCCLAFGMCSDTTEKYLWDSHTLLSRDHFPSNTLSLEALLEQLMRARTEEIVTRKGASPHRVQKFQW